MPGKKYPYLGSIHPDIHGEEFTCKEFANLMGISASGAHWRLQSNGGEAFGDVQKEGPEPVRYPYLGADPALDGDYSCAEFARAAGINPATAHYRLKRSGFVGFVDAGQKGYQQTGLSPEYYHDVPEWFLAFHKWVTCQAWR